MSNIGVKQTGNDKIKLPGHCTRVVAMATLFFYTKKATKKSLLKVLFLFIKIH